MPKRPVSLGTGDSSSPFGRAGTRDKHLVTRYHAGRKSSQLSQEFDSRDAGWFAGSLFVGTTNVPCQATRTDGYLTFEWICAVRPCPGHKVCPGQRTLGFLISRRGKRKMELHHLLIHETSNSLTSRADKTPEAVLMPMFRTSDVGHKYDGGPCHKDMGTE